MEILPAIDVWEGRLARFARGGPMPVRDPSGGDPVSTAEAYVAAGARWLHLVDMDLAFTGFLKISPMLRDIAQLGASVQASGGVTRTSEVETLLGSGANRVVLGSGALADRVSMAGILDNFGPEVAVGIEAEGGVIRPRGSAAGEFPLEETLEWIRTLEPSRLVATAVGAVGKSAGPDMDLIARAMRVGAPVIAAGGVATMEHLQELGSAGAEGAVVGRAALEGALDLAVALARFS
jgi:phosphoribosylformimino-5-aminoimidazole carboxamide ribonucleotide (ProFAR) isomerase